MLPLVLCVNVSVKKIRTNFFCSTACVLCFASVLCSLSLAMFEALRGLRDAVAPESGNLGAGTGGGGTQEASAEGGGDFEELWNNYRSGDPATVEKVHKANGGVVPKNRREDFIRIHAKLEMEKDTELVTKLARSVLEKSDQIDTRVSNLPGMHRTRTQQMEYIEQLLTLNQTAAQELEEAYATAQDHRDQVRTFIRNNTCQALGIVEDD